MCSARVFDGERLLDRPTVLVDGDAIVAAGVVVPESAKAIAMSSRSPKNVTLARSNSDVPTEAGDPIT